MEYVSEFASSIEIGRRFTKTRFAFKDGNTLMEKLKCYYLYPIKNN